MSVAHHAPFAHRLRGIAALFVLLHHYVSFLYAPPEGVVAAINMSPAGRDDYLPLLVQLLTWQNLLQPYAVDARQWGAFGVGLFFLVSGFVIPAALLRVRASGFLAARFVRLWPTYALALLSVIGLLVLAGNLAGNPRDFAPLRLLASFFWLEDMAYGRTTDLVSWTLTIEFMFYLFCAAIAPILRLANAGNVVMLAVLIGLTGYCLGQTRLLANDVFSAVFARNLLFMPYLFIGTLFHFHARRLLPFTSLLVNVAILLTLGIGGRVLLNQTEAANQGYHLAYLYALLTFALFYGLYGKIRLLPGVIGHAFDRLATISYPLYLVHAVHGYVVMNILLAQGAAVGVAALSATVWSLAVATLLHRLVERPSHAAARRLAARYPVKVNQVRVAQPLA